MRSHQKNISPLFFPHSRTATFFGGGWFGGGICQSSERKSRNSSEDSKGMFGLVRYVSVLVCAIIVPRSQNRPIAKCSGVGVMFVVESGS